MKIMNQKGVCLRKGKRFTRHGKIPVQEDADNHNSMKQNISTYWKKSRAAKIRWENKNESETSTKD